MAVTGMMDPKGQTTLDGSSIEEFYKSLSMIISEFRDREKFNTPAFLNRLEAEINKVFQLMRFFTMLKTRANKRKCMVKDILQDYDMEFQSG